MKRLSIFVLMALLIAAFIPAQAQSFVLGEPSGMRLIRSSIGDLPGFTWTALAAATSYDISVFKISTIPRDTALGEVFTQNVTLANCSPTACAYSPTLGQRNLIDRGRYAWTVIANTAGSDIEASNAPLYFSYEPSTMFLITNGGFETGTLAPWVGAGLAKDKLKAGFGNGGSWGFEFKGSATEFSKIIQSIPNVAYYGIDSNDTLTLSYDYKANSTAINGRLIAKVFYVATSGLPPKKVIIPASQQLTFFSASQNFTPDAAVRKIKVSAENFSTGGKFVVDNIQLVLLAAP